jgi:hypothetical protein
VSLTETLYELPRWPGDASSNNKPDPKGYADRVELLLPRLKQVRSCFEFGGHFGWGLVTWLDAFPKITWAGWTDNEGAIAGSNAACEENVRSYLGDRRCQLWWTTRPTEAVLGALKIDLVMVDGDHAYPAALVDLSLALAMRPKAIMVDDMQIGGVASAVRDFSQYSGLSYEEHSVAAGTAIFWLR